MAGEYDAPVTGGVPGGDVPGLGANATIPYAYSTTPQFSTKSKSKPARDETRTLEIAPGKRGGRAHSGSLSVADAHADAKGESTSGRPTSPMLEPYKGTYQSISPMPSPILGAGGRFDEDVSDLEPLEGTDRGLEGKKGKTKSTSRSAVSKEKDKKTKENELVVISPTSRKRVTFYDPIPDALAIKSAFSHTRSVDTKPLIRILPHLADEDMLTLRKEYKTQVKLQGKGINMAKHIRLRLGSGTAFGKACYATALGRWESEAYWANCYYQSSTSRRELLIESLFGRSNDEIAEIKRCFRDSRYGDSLERCMRAELKADKFRTAVLLALEGRRDDDENGRVDSGLVRDDVEDLHRALSARDGGETHMIYIIILRSDGHLREVLRTYERRYQRNFARAMIAKSQNLVVLPPPSPLFQCIGQLTNRAKHSRMYLMGSSIGPCATRCYCTRLCGSPVPEKSGRSC